MGGIFGGLVRGLTVGATGAYQGMNAANQERWRRQQIEQESRRRDELTRQQMAYQQTRDAQPNSDYERYLADPQGFLAFLEATRGPQAQPAPRPEYAQGVGAKGPGTYRIMPGGQPEFMLGAMPEAAVAGDEGWKPSDRVDADGYPLDVNKRGEYRRAEGVFNKPTEAQAKSLMTAPMVTDAKRSLDAMEDDPRLVASLVSKGGLLGNIVTTDTQRRYNDALETYLTAIYSLSGAAFPWQERENLLSRFGYQPGDDPATRMQKRQRRDVFVRSLLQNVPQPQRGELLKGLGASAGPVSGGQAPEGGDLTSEYEDYLRRQGAR